MQKAGAPDMRECDCDINTLEMKGTPLELTNEEILQAFTDAIGGLAVALGKQVDAGRLAADLRKLADETKQLGHGPSAGLLDEVARTIEVRLIKG